MRDYIVHKVFLQEGATVDWSWLGDVPVVGGSLVLLAGVVAGVLKVIPFVRRIGHFVDDWFGEDSRGGAARTPGVLDRLTAIEAKVARIEGQFTTNGGSTLRDAVNRVEAAVTDQEGGS